MVLNVKKYATKICQSEHKLSTHVSVHQVKAMEPTIFIPLAVTLVLFIGGTLFYRHRRRREKHRLDEKEEAIRKRDADNDLPQKPDS